MDVTGTLADRHRTALRAWSPALPTGQHGTVLGEGLGDLQPVGAHRGVLQGIGQSRCQQLTHVTRSAVTIVPQVVQRLIDAAAANQIQHAPGLEDAHASMSVNSTSLKHALSPSSSDRGRSA